MQKCLSDGFRKSFFRKTASLSTFAIRCILMATACPCERGEIVVLFNGMSQRMPQIQQLPQTGIEFILIDNIRFIFTQVSIISSSFFLKITRMPFPQTGLHPLITLYFSVSAMPSAKIFGQSI